MPVEKAFLRRRISRSFPGRTDIDCLSSDDSNHFPLKIRSSRERAPVCAQGSGPFPVGPVVYGHTSRAQPRDVTRRRIGHFTWKFALTFEGDLCRNKSATWKERRKKASYSGRKKKKNCQREREREREKKEVRIHIWKGNVPSPGRMHQSSSSLSLVEPPFFSVART